MSIRNAPDADEPIFCIAGIYGFLTTDPNDLVKPIHEKAMPVLLLTKEEPTWQITFVDRRDMEDQSRRPH
ncbi:hypothetical protein ACRYWZ_18115 (plasmid) [Agrobacterium deltaense]|uniref:hypothetical protein n=1 Tax=Agrobacterium deltaense TaxID=1183412 RepID=UPI003D958C67